MDEYKEVPERANGEENSYFHSKILFLYLLPFIRTGFKRTLKKCDFWRLEKCDESANLTNAFETNWEEELKTAKECVRAPDLHKVISGTFARSYWFLSIFVFCQEILQCAQLFFMNRLIRYFQYCSDISAQYAYYYAAWFSAVSFLLVVVRHRPLHELTRIVMRWRIACSALIYKKCLKLNSSALREIEIGKIVSLLSNDVNRFDQAILFLPYIWVTPLSIIMYSVFVCCEMSPTYLAGFLPLLIFNPLQIYLSRKAGTLRPSINVYTDKRISLINDLLNGIRVIKMYTWEGPFAHLIDQIRTSEMKRYCVVAVFDSLIYGLFFANTKIFVLVAVLFNFYFEPLTNRMKSDHIFVVTSMFNIVRSSMGLFLPRAIKFYAEYRVSVQRIQEFLTLKEQCLQNLKSGGEKSHSKKENQISVNNFSAKHSERCHQVNAIENISFQLNPGDLLMIVGPVGSGKSTLLQCLCGDVGVRTSGAMKVNGRTVYLPQKPWVFQGTLRQNVIFGSDDRSLDAGAYSKVLEVCSLDKDIRNFPKKDKTFIGDRGSALSGGQKARIALARAVYFDADIYLLDDPLAAVDATVGRFIFDKCINGYLKSKTRLLVTNQLQYLKYADQIIVLKNGKVEAFGSYEHLVAAGDQFTSILRETEDSVRLGRDESPRDGGIEEKPMNTENLPSKNKNDNDWMTSESSAKVKDDINEENVAHGRIKWNVVTTYFGSMGNCITVWSLFVFFFVGQVLFNFDDYWLNLWKAI